MYRVILSHNKTGETIPAWHYVGRDAFGYFKDLTLKEKIDISQYSIIDNPTKDSIPVPFQLFGVECEKGWYPLIQPVIDYIDKFNEGKSEEEKIYITQIKEKYGTLRIYVSYGTDELFNMIDKAEEESAHTCEFCGTKENVGQTTGWITTLCHDCIKNLSKERGFGHYWSKEGKVYEIFPDDADLDRYVGSEEEFYNRMP